MNCRQVKRAISGHQTTFGLTGELDAHVRSCESCRQKLAIEKITQELVRCHSLEVPDLSHWDEVRLVNRIKIRIREMGDRNAGSWENAVIAVRGWLIAFGVVAFLLLTLSGQIAISNSYNQQVPVQEARTEGSLGEDMISTNVAAGWLAGEEPENAH